MLTESDGTDVQTQQDGEGTLFERRYWADVQHSVFTPEDVMTYIKSHFNDFSPDLLAKFEKTEGQEEVMSEGDEMSIEILGPWNGDVRVTHSEATWFELITLEGHPEAGTIRFKATELPDVPGGVHFEIRSLARARDNIVALAHEKLGIGMVVQERMWREFCTRVADFTHGELIGEVQSRTLNRDEESWWAGV